MKAMILAAGRGERMGALTARRPKPLLSLGGESLIERHLRHLAAAGFAEVVINLSHHGERIRAALGDGARFGLAIEYSDEGEPPLETGGGIVQALPLLGNGAFALINADIFTDFDYATLAELEGRPTLVLVPNPAHHPRGDFGLGANGRLSLRAPRLTFAGISLLDTAMFEEFEPGRRPLKPVLDTAIEARALFGLRYEGCWLDVGTPARLTQARALALRLENAAAQPRER